jgi:hypothetical protein
VVRIKGRPGAIRASPARGRDEKLLLQRIETAAAIADFALDVAIGHTPAKTHDHERAPFASDFNLNDTTALRASEFGAV